jgi:hypothetical protein
MSSEQGVLGSASKRDGGWGRGRGGGGGKRHKQQAVAPPPSAAADLPLPEGGIHIDGSMLEGGAS